jgi:hypothetical protein
MDNQRALNTVRTLALVDGSGNRLLDVEPEPLAMAVAEATVKSSVEIARSCPEPKREDIYKMLAIQAHCLNEHGLLLLRLSNNSVRNKPFYIDYGLKLTREAKDIFQALIRDPGFDPLPLPPSQQSED